MNYVTCTLPDGTKPSEFDPFPGSAKAQKLGCTCPEDQAASPLRRITFAVDCPIHELEHVKN